METKNPWKKLKEFYEVYSLVVGFGAAMTISYFLILDRMDHCICLMEPIWWVRIPEIIMGISVIPYYFKKIYGG